MKYDRQIQISTAGSRKAIFWPRQTLMWSEFVENLKTPVRSSETMEEYLKLHKSKQDELKDVGGFVGGVFTANRRKACYVEGRDLITLDLDNIEAGKTEDILKRVDGLGCACVVYSTRKHTGYAPRLRIIFVVDKTILSDEYEPCARRLASLIGMNFCDPTTFDVSRLMYRPSCCKGAEYVYRVYDKPFCSTDGLLRSYGNWKDCSSWPQVPGQKEKDIKRVAEQADPLKKSGIVGAFCRTYDVLQAMEEFIPGVYEATTKEGRYTYIGGSTAGGAVIYDNNMFLYSHHATDPCSGELVNAFDLIRLHKFGKLDDVAKVDMPSNKLPSFIEMSRLAKADIKVNSLLQKERYENVVQVFGDSITSDQDDISWLQELARDSNGNLKVSVNNFILILKNDKSLKGKIAIDEFAGRGLVLGSLPWNGETEKRTWTDADDSGIFWYMETAYNMASRDKIADAVTIIGNQNKFNVVKEYLQKLEWDNVKRVDTLLTDYLGAEDSPYTRAVIRKSLCAAAARAVIGGVKYDYMPILTGEQGLGKSTFLSTLGKEWFSDSLTTFEGKEAAELIQGTWINEVGELTALTRQETNAVKQFLSKKEDIYRAAYGRHTQKRPRRSVFFGTSNETDFLKDTTGNRRFWPVEVGINAPKKSVWEDLPGEVDMIWAEVYAYFMQGEKLYLPKEIENTAKQIQNEYTEKTGKEGIIESYLNTPVPINWYSLSLSMRRQFLRGNLHIEGELMLRDKICAVEVYEECFMGDVKWFKRGDAIEINKSIATIPCWKKQTKAVKFINYGVQKGFRRII